MTNHQTKALQTRGRALVKRTPPEFLYHFTCHHGFAGISKTGVLQASVHPLMPHLGPLLWLTDEATPSSEALGLTDNFTKCDRMAYRYCVNTRAALPWSAVRDRAQHNAVIVLEKYRDPSHWWVVRRSLLASEFTLDVVPHVTSQEV